jgi:putative ABC transport system permease protein
VRTSRAVVYQNNNYYTSIQGSGVQFLQIRGWDVMQGRFFTEGETRSMAKVCVIGTTVRDNLFPGGEEPIGKIIRISSLPFEVVGVLESKGAGMLGDQDDVVVAPYTTVMHKIQGLERINNILVSAQNNKADLAELEITALLRQRLRLQPKDDNTFMIRKQDDWVKTQDQQASVLTTFLALAASISLLVGGIGISNIMLVSVTERTREIGVRRAMGATRSNILWQFLTEAVVLSVLGGIIGVAFAFLTIWILRTFTSLPAITDTGSQSCQSGCDRRAPVRVTRTTNAIDGPLPGAPVPGVPKFSGRVRGADHGHPGADPGDGLAGLPDHP